MVDGNITEEAIDHACHFCAANHIPGKSTWRPTRGSYCLRPFHALINFRFPNFCILQMKNNAMALNQTFTPAFNYLCIYLIIYSLIFFEVENLI